MLRHVPILEGLAFALDEIEVSLAPSLLVTFLHPCVHV